MSKTQQGAAPSTNQGGADLQIPRMAAGSPATGPVLQEGEDEQAMTGGSAPNTQDTGFEESEEEDYGNRAPQGTPVHKPESLAQLQVRMDAADARRPGRNARDATISRRYGQADLNEANVAPETLNIPTRGRLEDMGRPDLHIEPVTDLGRFKEKAEELAFLEEFITINIAPSDSPTAENPVQAGINGRMVYIWRGRNTTLRRKYVEQLLRAKPQHIKTNYHIEQGSGEAKNTVTKTTTLAYPVTIVRDENPRGPQWYQRILRERR